MNKLNGMRFFLNEKPLALHSNSIFGQKVSKEVLKSWPILESQVAKVKKQGSCVYLS